MNIELFDEMDSYKYLGLLRINTNTARKNERRRINNNTFMINWCTFLKSFNTIIIFRLCFSQHCFLHIGLTLSSLIDSRKKRENEKADLSTIIRKQCIWSQEMFPFPSVYKNSNKSQLRHVEILNKKCDTRRKRNV